MEKSVKNAVFKGFPVLMESDTFGSKQGPSVQAEFFLFSAPTFMEGFDLKFHMPGHFPRWDVIFTYLAAHFAILHKNRTKLL